MGILPFIKKKVEGFSFVFTVYSGLRVCFSPIWNLAPGSFPQTAREKNPVWKTDTKGGFPHGFYTRRRGGGITPSVIACGDATFPKGTAFGGGDKVSGIAQRRPLGGAGAQRLRGFLPELPQSRLRRASPLGDGAFGMAVQFPAKVQSLRARQRLPLRGSWQNR